VYGISVEAFINLIVNRDLIAKKTKLKQLSIQA